MQAVVEARKREFDRFIDEKFSVNPPVAEAGVRRRRGAGTAGVAICFGSTPCA